MTSPDSLLPASQGVRREGNDSILRGDTFGIDETKIADTIAKLSAALAPRTDYHPADGPGFRKDQIERMTTELGFLQQAEPGQVIARLTGVYALVSESEKRGDDAMKIIDDIVSSFPEIENYWSLLTAERWGLRLTQAIVAKRLAETKQRLAENRS